MSTKHVDKKVFDQTMSTKWVRPNTLSTYQLSTKCLSTKCLSTKFCRRSICRQNTLSTNDMQFLNSMKNVVKFKKYYIWKLILIDVAKPKNSTSVWVFIWVQVREQIRNPKSESNSDSGFIGMELESKL